MLFKRLIEEGEFELIGYVKQYLNQHHRDDVKIHVGCDSKI